MLKSGAEIIPKLIVVKVRRNLAKRTDKRKRKKTKQTKQNQIIIIKL